MKYEELIKELCDVIKESELNAQNIYDDLLSLQENIESTKLLQHTKNKLQEKISNSMGLLQHQDLNRQKIERVVNIVCEYNNIDKSKYNLAPSAKHISGNESDEVLSSDELEELIKSMQN